MNTSPNSILGALVLWWFSLRVKFTPSPCRPAALDTLGPPESFLP